MKPRQDTGAVAITVALFLPLILATIFMILWFAVTSNAVNALSNAMGVGGNLGLSRGNHQRMGLNPARLASSSTSDGIIPAIERYRAGAPWSEVEELLTTPELRGGGYNAEAIYDGWVNDVFSNPTLRSIPGEYIYTLVYVQQFMRESIGPTVRFPCDPELNTPNNGPGCLRCRFINPSANLATGTPGPFTPWNCTGGTVQCPAPLDRIRMECAFSPDVVFANPVVKMLGVMTGSGGIMQRVFKNYMFVLIFPDPNATPIP